MKILILGDASSPHIIKWANSLQTAGLDIVIFSLDKFNKSDFNKDIEIYHCSGTSDIQKTSSVIFSKLFYLTAVPQIKSLIKKIKPDIVHAHYASSYGLLGALTGFHPYIISVWGGDVIDFPEISPVHRHIFKYNLRKSDRILSTSSFMAKLLQSYTGRIVDITPFGIDTSVFKPGEKINLLAEDYDCVIGTIKGLEWYYGIEYLIEAFHLVTQRMPEKKLKLLIVGSGSLETKIRTLVKDLNLEDKVLLTGKINYTDVHKYHNLLDIFVAVSVYEETFGVSVLEASACEKPVIISGVGGMIDVVEENTTGFIVPPRNAEATADKIMKLINNPVLRESMGKAGRKLVDDHYNLNGCLNKMIDVYINAVRARHLSNPISGNKKTKSMFREDK